MVEAWTKQRPVSVHEGHHIVGISMKATQVCIQLSQPFLGLPHNNINGSQILQGSQWLFIERLT